MKKIKKTNNMEKIKKIFDFPLGSLSNLPIMEIVSNSQIKLEGYKSILEYDENIIRIDTGKIEFVIIGIYLQMELFNEDSMIITGKFSSLEFRS